MSTNQFSVGQKAFVISGSLAEPQIFEVMVTWVGVENVRIVDAVSARFVPRSSVFESRELARLALIKIEALGAA